jgi:hypothetical protein
MVNYYVITKTRAAILNSAQQLGLDLYGKVDARHRPDLLARVLVVRVMSNKTTPPILSSWQGAKGRAATNTSDLGAFELIMARWTPDIAPTCLRASFSLVRRG